MNHITIDTINTFDQAGFVAALGHLFEGSPWIAEQAWPQRPFADAAQLHAALCATVAQAPAARKIALIQAHPDLAGKAAMAGALSPESTSEQASARLDRLSPDEYAAFTRLNSSYRAQFGFPFVICVREHTSASILANFAQRLQHGREQEIDTALDEIAKIARLRLHDVVSASEQPRRHEGAKAGDK
ncbi:MAG: 2-oxo-4-hydroxy-4-carboxy-5-ureidoimidazoline decarboxylase [Roseiflexaceae bacterium]|nr:2-oxo-4-hydroxy-4-carboxy-5-ureidoimidazoline decarboxylase [Roseiflexaceae bacterium]